MEAYVGNNFPDFLPGAAFNLLAEGTKRTARRNVAILERWIQRRFANNHTQIGQNGADTLLAIGAVRPPISVSQIVGFLMYRVAGERLSTDIHSGSVDLATFLNSDLYPIMCLLRHQERIDFTYQEMKQNREFKDAVVTCRKRRGETTSFSSARPIYPQDEQRLRSCLTMDTAFQREEAILILGLRSGFRTRSISLIRMDLHVRQLPGNALEIIIPGCKTNRLVDFRQILTGEDYLVLMRWILHRRQIARLSPINRLNKRPWIERFC